MHVLTIPGLFFLTNLLTFLDIKREYLTSHLLTVQKKDAPSAVQ